MNFIIISRLEDTKGITYRSATLSPGFTHINELIQSAVFICFEIQVHLEVLHFNVTQDMSLIPEPSDALLCVKPNKWINMGRICGSQMK